MYLHGACDAGSISSLDQELMDLMRSWSGIQEGKEVSIVW